MVVVVRSVTYQKGDWVDAQSALAAVNEEVSRRFDRATAQNIATVHWLFALMFDTWMILQ